ncbi:hypothetical protein K439DRAFT_1139250 [Ramaria rubella]|nr:hypothetical protein K439DRAFT_1139250 [Ramaria rubella]
MKHFLPCIRYPVLLLMLSKAQPSCSRISFLRLTTTTNKQNKTKTKTDDIQPSMSQSSRGGGNSALSRTQGHSLGESKNKNDGDIIIETEDNVFIGVTSGPQTPSKTRTGEYCRSPSGTSPANQKRKVTKEGPTSNRTDSVIQNA